MTSTRKKIEIAYMQKLSLSTPLDILLSEFEKHIAAGWSVTSFRGRLYSGTHLYSELLRIPAFKEASIRYRKKQYKRDFGLAADLEIPKDKRKSV